MKLLKRRLVLVPLVAAAGVFLMSRVIHAQDPVWDWDTDCTDVAVAELSLDGHGCVFGICWWSWFDDSCSSPVEEVNDFPEWHDATVPFDVDDQDDPVECANATPKYEVWADIDLYPHFAYDEISDDIGTVFYYDGSGSLITSSDLEVEALDFARGVIPCSDNMTTLPEKVKFEWGRGTGHSLGKGRAAEEFEIIVRCCVQSGS